MIRKLKLSLAITSGMFSSLRWLQIEGAWDRAISLRGGRLNPLHPLVLAALAREIFRLPIFPSSPSSSISNQPGSAKRFNSRSVVSF